MVQNFTTKGHFGNVLSLRGIRVKIQRDYLFFVCVCERERDREGLQGYTGVFAHVRMMIQGMLPKRPMNAVSTRDARGSAANATKAGRAMPAISHPSSSALNAYLS